MAITTTQVPGIWAAARTKAVAAGVQELSDIITPDQTCVDITITCKADNSATPVSGDTMNFYVVPTSGDADNDAADDYPIDTSMMHRIAVIDTFVNDPDSKDVALPYVPYKYKIAAVSNAAANSITVSFTTREMRA